MIVGIDNGVSGGLVAIGPLGHIIAKIVMPIQRARKGNEIDVRAVYQWMVSIQARADITAVIIEEPGGSKSAKAACSMAGSFHALRAVCEIRSYRWHRVTPREWQKVMLPGCAGGDTKPRALAKARQLWPDEDWRASDRCKIAHDGLIDAALIAEFARLKNL